MHIETIDSSEYRGLTPIEHAIKRASIYIGSVRPAVSLDYVLGSDGKIHAEELTYVNGAVILASELINNAYDEYVKRLHRKGRPIDTIDVVVDLSMRSITVRDNGGIKIALHEESGKLLPSFLFGELRTGSNYNDDDRLNVGGLNGLGAMLVNLFSKAFHVRVFDDNDTKYFQQTWRNSSADTNEDWRDNLHPTEPQQGMVEVIAEFDTEMLPTEAYSLEWARLIEVRCASIAAMGSKKAPLTVNYRCITKDGGGWTKTFRFNKFSDYISLFPNGEHFITDEQEHFSVALGPSNGSFETVGIVNGLRCSEGPQIDRYISACTYHIRKYINDRHHVDVRPAKIKSYIKAVSIWNVNKPEFSGQTKNELANDIRDLHFRPEPSERAVQRLLNSAIVRNIADDLHKQIIAERRKELQSRERDQQKQLASRMFSPKLTDAAFAGRRKGCELFVVEGDSAAGGFIRFRNGNGMQGVLAMQGKAMGNVIYDDELSVMNRNSFDTLMTALGLSFTRRSKLRYDKIILAQDADFDGNSITALLLVFFVKYFPWLIERGHVYKLMTPAYIASKGKETREFYSQSDFDDAKHELEGWSIKFHKGLSQIKPEDFKRIMSEPKLTKFKLDQDASLSMHTWFGKAPENKDERKHWLSKALNAEPDMSFIDYALDSDASDKEQEQPQIQ